MTARRAFVSGFVSGALLTALVTWVVGRVPRNPEQAYADCVLRNASGNQALVIYGCNLKHPH